MLKFILSFMHYIWTYNFDIDLKKWTDLNNCTRYCGAHCSASLPNILSAGSNKHKMACANQPYGVSFLQSVFGAVSETHFINIKWLVFHFFLSLWKTLWRCEVWLPTPEERRWRLSHRNPFEIPLKPWKNEERMKINEVIHSRRLNWLIQTLQETDLIYLIVWNAINILAEHRKY